jgi:AraC family transcriptional regulator
VGWPPDQSLREILDRMVLTKEVWAAALMGGRMPQWTAPRRPIELCRPCWHASRELARSSTECSKMCAAAVSGTTRLSMRCANRLRLFTLGGMFAHVNTFNAYRRMLAMDTLLVRKTVQ